MVGQPIEDVEGLLQILPVIGCSDRKRPFREGLRHPPILELRVGADCDDLDSCLCSSGEVGSRLRTHLGRECHKGGDVLGPVTAQCRSLPDLAAPAATVLGLMDDQGTFLAAQDDLFLDEHGFSAASATGCRQRCRYREYIYPLDCSHRARRSVGGEPLTEHVDCLCRACRRPTITVGIHDPICSPHQGTLGIVSS